MGVCISYANKNFERFRRNWLRWPLKFDIDQALKNMSAHLTNLKKYTKKSIANIEEVKRKSNEH
jgi:hypothetical protein